jgi:hypothetical protein
MVLPPVVRPAADLRDRSGKELQELTDTQRQMMTRNLQAELKQDVVSFADPGATLHWSDCTHLAAVHRVQMWCMRRRFRAD